MLNYKHFQAPDLESITSLIANSPLATLAAIATNQELLIDHIPLLYVIRADGKAVLQGHMAGNNPFGHAINQLDCTAIFHGPQSYISPDWYPSKHKDGKAVPTWNYAVVHVKGKFTTIEDFVWLENHLNTMSSIQEAKVNQNWRLQDAPRDYIDKMLQYIVGFEIEINDISGKWKMSQNRPIQNQQGVIDGLKAQPHHTQHDVATIIKNNLNNKHSN